MGNLNIENANNPKTDNKAHSIEKIEIISYLFAAFSFIAGPVLFFLAATSHESGLDCQDYSWSSHTPIELRAEIYSQTLAPLTFITWFFAFVCAVLIISCIYQAFKKPKYLILIAVFFLVFMLLGYLILIFWWYVPCGI